MTPRPSPLQNRILPTGEIVADPARGMLTGNRGILGFTNGQLGRSRWKHPHWIICTLTHPKGRYHGPMPLRAWTPLFFLDEAVGLGAGHRPCAYCRPQAYKNYKSCWAEAMGAADHTAMDRHLHRSRVTRDRQQVRHTAELSSLPDGAFLLWQDQPHLLSDSQLWPYFPDHYGAPLSCPTGTVTVLTPQPNLRVLNVGYAPLLHPSQLSSR